MRIEQIEELMMAMHRHDIEKLSWREKETQVELSRSSAANQLISNRDLVDGIIQEEKAIKSPKKSQSDGQNPTHWIVSPMVGICYLTPSPETAPFVQLGSRVEESSVICIIEAMKVMNEVRVPFTGILEEISIKSGSAVEFGTPLFRITPLASENPLQ